MVWKIVNKTADCRFLAREAHAAVRGVAHLAASNPPHLLLQVLRRLPHRCTDLCFTVLTKIPGCSRKKSIAQAILAKDIQAAATFIGEAQTFFEADLLAEAFINPGEHYPHAQALWLAAIGEIPSAVKVARADGRESLARHLLMKSAIQTHSFELPLDKLPHTSPVSQLSQHNSSLRVLHILTNSLPHTQSGYSLRTQAVLHAQRETGIDARAVTRLNYPATVGKLAGQSCEVIDDVPYYRLVNPHIPAGEPHRLLAQAAAIVELIEHLYASEGWQPDIIHCTTEFRNALVAQAVAHKLSVPWVYEMRGQLYNTWLSRVPEEYRKRAQNSWHYKTLQAKELQMAQRANAVVALSHTQRDELIRSGIAAEKITVASNAIYTADIGRTMSAVEAREELGFESLGLPLDAKIFGSVSAVVGYEGFETALQALRLLRDGFPEQDYRFVLVGDGVARPGLEALANELGLRDAVFFAGRKEADEAKLWYQAFDCFVIPRVDSEVTRAVTPIKGLQAAGYGIPIVASELPALAEIVPPAPAGILVTPENPEDLADGILKATGTVNPSLSYSAQAFARSHTWEANAQKYYDLYNKIYTDR